MKKRFNHRQGEAMMAQDGRKGGAVGGLQQTK